MIKIETTHTASDTNLEGQYIPKSYQFERDMDTESIDERYDSLEFDEDSNIHFVYPNMKDLLNTENGKKTLSHMIGVFFSSQKERLDILDGYSKGRNYTILNGRRRLEQEKSDYRISHNWGGYISNYITGYLMTKPITIGTKEVGDDENKALEKIQEINVNNDIDTLNFELGFDASRFGRAFELHYREEDGTDRIVQIDPTEMFVIRSTDVSKRMIGAIHLPIYNDEINMTIYTDTHVIKYKPFKQGAVSFSEVQSKKHLYQEVPVVEWFNNRFRQGDFENELSLIDAYDSAQSDTANYMSDLNDALLFIKGDMRALGDVNSAAIMKQANMIIAETGMDVNGKQTDIDAKFLYKQYDVQGSEAYKQRLVNDIYKLSKVPNLDDDSFNAQNSGIALRYKMLGLEQIRSIKESFFSKALRRRYRLIENIHRGLSDTSLTAKDLTFTFHENIPQDIWAEVKKYINVGGVVSDITLMELASFIPNTEDEFKKIAKDGIGPDATDSEKAVIEDGKE